MQPESRDLFSQALAALDGGDIEALSELLDFEPSLVNARVQTVEPPYDGYFAGATLLHHVAGNPVRGPLPRRTVEAARLLLARGAQVDAPCGGGPAQPESGGGTTLGLVVSGARAHVDGHSEALIDLLLEAGAAMDGAGNGGLMWIALYHTVEHRGQRDVARVLYDRGHPVDLCFAAGLGLDEEVRGRLSDGPGVGDRYYRHHRRGGEATPAELLQDVLTFAVVNGWPTTTKLLLQAGASPNASRPWGGEDITPLHGAAWAGWPALIPVLLDAGADPTITDPRHSSTPLEWARHCKRPEAIEGFALAGVDR